MTRQEAMREIDRLRAGFEAAVEHHQRAVKAVKWFVSTKPDDWELWAWVAAFGEALADGHTHFCTWCGFTTKTGEEVVAHVATCPKSPLAQERAAHEVTRLALRAVCDVAQRSRSGLEPVITYEEFTAVMEHAILVAGPKPEPINPPPKPAAPPNIIFKLGEIPREEP